MKNLFYKTVLSALLFSPLFIHSISYQLIDIGLTAYKESEATSMNELGQICGRLRHKNETHVFFWDPKAGLKSTPAYTTTNPVMNDASTIYGSYWTRARDANWEFTAELLFRWENPLNYFVWWNFKYPRIPWAEGQTAFGPQVRMCIKDVNNHGQFILTNTDTYSLERIWNYTTWIRDGFYYTKIQDPRFQMGIKINNHSVALGLFQESEVTLNSSTILGYKTSLYDLKTKTIRVLEFPDNAFGRDLNDQGKIAGAFYNPETEELEGFLGDPAIDLLVLPDFIPNGLNNHDQMVGHLLKGDEEDWSPRIWMDNTLFSLEDVGLTLIDQEGKRWDSLDMLTAINDRGEIIGEGQYKGAKHSFLLQPIP